MTSKNIKKLMYTNSYILLTNMIIEQEPFRLVIWNNNNWSEKLPEDVMKQYPKQLVIDIKDQTLEDTFIDEDGSVVLSCSFSPDVIYTKTIFETDIIGIIDLNGQPMHLNNFKPDAEIEEVTASKELLLKELLNDGAPKENVINSINAFAKNNPGMF